MLALTPGLGRAYEWSLVDAPGNSADPSTGHGAVPYQFVIGTYEVTNAEYVDFLNAVAATDLTGPHAYFHPAMQSYELDETTIILGGIIRTGTNGSYTYDLRDSAFADKPAAFISFWRAARYANWLHNGRPVGARSFSTTEGGAYFLASSAVESRAAARDPWARVFVPSEDEWYKAAYYDPVQALYFDYPTGTDAQVQCLHPNSDDGNAANCNHATDPNRLLGTSTQVGSYDQSGSPQNTYDQAGNMTEWTDSSDTAPDGWPGYVLRGGAWGGTSQANSSSHRNPAAPNAANLGSGFRVAALPVGPEAIPPDLSALVLCGSQSGHNLVELNLSTGDVHSQAPLGFTLNDNHQLEIDKITGDVYVADNTRGYGTTTDGAIYRIDASGNVSLVSIPGNHFVGIAAEAGRLFAVRSPHSTLPDTEWVVGEVDTSTGPSGGTVRTVFQKADIECTPVGVSELTLHHGTLYWNRANNYGYVAAIPVDGSPADLRFLPDLVRGCLGGLHVKGFDLSGEAIWAAYGWKSQRLGLLNTRTGTIHTGSDLAGPVWDLEIDEFSKLAVTISGQNGAKSLEVVDVRTGQRVATMTVPGCNNPSELELIERVVPSVPVAAAAARMLLVACLVCGAIAWIARDYRRRVRFLP